VWTGTARALEFLLDVGPAAIAARDLDLAGRFRAGLEELGASPLFGAEGSSQIVALRIPDAARVEEALGREGVVAAVRAGYLRTSFHFFNDEEDVDRALHALRSALA
jgi:selenocysteine lyase/cysteine desulfurase